MAVGRAVVWGHHQDRSYRVWPIIFLATQCSQCRPGLPIQTVLSSVSRTWCKYPDRHLPTSPPSTNRQTINPCLGSEFLPWTGADITIPVSLNVNNLILNSPTPKSDYQTCISGKWLWAWAWAWNWKVSARVHIICSGLKNANISSSFLQTSHCASAGRGS